MANPVAALRRCKDGDVEYDHLWFVCPGCKTQHDDATGLHALPVNGTVMGATKRPFWTFDGNLAAPTLAPSILSRGGRDPSFVCHSFLKAGVFEFLGDCTHALKGQRVPMVPLPDWFMQQEKT